MLYQLGSVWGYFWRIDVTPLLWIAQVECSSLRVRKHIEVSQPKHSFILIKSPKNLHGRESLKCLRHTCLLAAHSGACVPVDVYHNSTEGTQKGRGGHSELCYICLLFSFFPEPQATGRHQGHLGATLLKYEMRGQWRDGPTHDILLLALSSLPPPLSPGLWWLRYESLFH